MLALLEARPFIVGASLGGWIATAVLGEAGGEHLATGLVLVDAPPRMDVAASTDISERLRRASRPDGARWDPRVLDGFDTAAAEPRLLAAAGNVKVPTLVLRGDRSPLASREAVEELAAAIMDVEVREVSGAGHLVAVDQTDAFSALVLDSWSAGSRSRRPSTAPGPTRAPCAMRWVSSPPA